VAAELTTNLAVLERLVALEGRDVLDIGCGGGGLVRALAARGARAVGLETSERQLRDARERRVDGRARYVVGRAEALPFADGSLDAVLFVLSLHHVPTARMATALREAARVLRSGGVIHVAEPLTDGDYYQLVRIVDDEDEVRAAAQAAIAEAVADGLRRLTCVEYDIGTTIADLHELRQRIVNVDPERAATFDAHLDELAASFERLGEAHADGRWLSQPMRADLLAPAS